MRFNGCAQFIAIKCGGIIMKSMKQLIALSLALCMLVALAACGTSATAPASGTEATLTSSSPDDKVYTITMNSTWPNLDSNNSIAGYAVNTWFFEEVTKRTNGHVVFDTYWSGALFKASEILDAMQGSALDMAFVTPHAYGEIVPEGFLTTMPMWTDSTMDAHNAYRQTEIWSIFEEAFLEVNMRPLYVLYIGNYGFMSKTPINSTADLKGKLIRSSGTLYKLWFDELGLTSVDITSAEAYDALQKGILDIDCQGWSTLETVKLGEVINYCVYPQYQNSVGVAMFMDEKLFQSLPTEYQDIILEVAFEAEAMAISDEATAQGNEQLEVHYEKYDIQFTTIEDADRLVDTVQVMFDYWAGMNEGCAKLVDIIYEWAGW